MSSTPSYSTGRIRPQSSSSSHEISHLPAPLKVTCCSSWPSPFPRGNQGSILLKLICHWAVVKRDISFFQCAVARGWLLKQKYAGSEGRREFVVRASASRKSQFLLFCAATGFLCDSRDVIWSLSPSVKRRRVITSFFPPTIHILSLYKRL